MNTSGILVLNTILQIIKICVITVSILVVMDIAFNRYIELQTTNCIMQGSV